MSMVYVGTATAGAPFIRTASHCSSTKDKGGDSSRRPSPLGRPTPRVYSSSRVVIDVAGYGKAAILLLDRDLRHVTYPATTVQGSASFVRARIVFAWSFVRKHCVLGELKP